MRLEDIDGEDVRGAIGLYLDEAWGELASTHWPAMNFESLDLDGLLEYFVDERKGGGMRRYTLRLGNRRYPFMKLVLEELLLRNRFFFSVDTHDELDIKSTTPDYGEWIAIREYNERLKGAIEKRWRSSTVPTFAQVLEDLRAQTVPDDQVCAARPSPMVWVIDDDHDIAEGVSVILTRRGYGTRVFHTAEEALEALEGGCPDLVLSDLELGSGATGLELCERLRARDEGGDVPFILATAASIDLAASDSIDGFLVKPYEIALLMRFVSQHLPA